jgi:hypothetical protein
LAMKRDFSMRKPCANCHSFSPSPACKREKGKFWAC